MDLSFWIRDLEIVGALLAAPSFLLAIKGLREGAQQLSTLQSVAHSLTTRSVGVHPDYMKDVIGIVADAKRELLIMSAVPGFGIYSSPSQWEQLRAAVIDAKTRLESITMVTATAESRRERVRLQFQDAFRDWDAWIGDKGNKAKFDLFCRSRSLREPSTDQARWLEHELIRLNDELRPDVYGPPVKLKESNDFLPVVAWIGDRNRAVFGLSDDRGRFPGFYTEDRSIIDALIGFAQRVIDEDRLRQTPRAEQDLAKGT